MKNQNTILLIIVIILTFYLFQPVPYCKMSLEEFEEEEAIYTEQDVRDLGEIEATNLGITGTSMFPTIQENSQCLCIKKETYSVGDIVFFMVKMNNEWTGIAHRIFSIDCRGIITKGDANSFLDPVLQEENIYCFVPEVPRWRTLI